MKLALVLAAFALVSNPSSSRAAADPKAAGASGTPAKRISIKNLTCEQWAALPDDIRPMVAAWVHGFFYRESWKDAWELDVDQARGTLAALADACKESPQASFRYKFGEVVKKHRAKAAAR